MKKNPNSTLALAGALVRHGRGARARQLLLSLWRRTKVSSLPTPPRLLALAAPRVSLRSRRKAGITYRVPYVLGSTSHFSYALRWFRAAVRERTERLLDQRLGAELFELSQRKGGTWRRRDALHQTALLNRGFIRLLRR